MIVIRTDENDLYCTDHAMKSQTKKQITENLITDLIDYLLVDIQQMNQHHLSTVGLQQTGNALVTTKINRFDGNVIFSIMKRNHFYLFLSLLLPVYFFHPTVCHVSCHTSIRFLKLRLNESTNHHDSLSMVLSLTK